MLYHFKTFQVYSSCEKIWQEEVEKLYFKTFQVYSSLEKFKNMSTVMFNFKTFQVYSSYNIHLLMLK